MRRVWDSTGLETTQSSEDAYPYPTAHSRRNSGRKKQHNSTAMAAENYSGEKSLGKSPVSVGVRCKDIVNCSQDELGKACW